MFGIEGDERKSKGGGVGVRKAPVEFNVVSYAGLIFVFVLGLRGKVCCM